MYMAELGDLSIILLSPKKLPKLEHLDKKPSELHEELPAESESDPFSPVRNTELSSLEDLSCSVTEILAN